MEVLYTATSLNAKTSLESVYSCIDLKRRILIMKPFWRGGAAIGHGSFAGRNSRHENIYGISK